MRFESGFEAVGYDVIVGDVSGRCDRGAAGSGRLLLHDLVEFLDALERAVVDCEDDVAALDLRSLRVGDAFDDEAIVEAERFTLRRRELAHGESKTRGALRRIRSLGFCR